MASNISILNLLNKKFQLTERYIFEWCALLTLSASVFIFFSYGRPPSVDASQHALTLERIIYADTKIFQINWTAPYLLYYIISIPFVPFVGYSKAIWWSAALVLSSLPLASGYLARQLDLTPLLGSIAFLGVYSTCTVFGFYPYVLGVSCSVVATAISIKFAHNPTWRSGFSVGFALLITYFVHLAAFVAGVALCTLSIFVIAWPFQRYKTRLFAPVMVTLLICMPLIYYWKISSYPGHAYSEIPFFAYPTQIKLQAERLGTDSAGFGRDHALSSAWSWLLFASFGVWLTSAVFAVKIRSNPLGWRHYLLGLIPIVWGLGYLTFPYLLFFKVYWIPTRLLLYAYMTLPFLFIVVNHRILRWGSWLLAILSMPLNLQAWQEIKIFDKQHDCFENLIASARQQEKVVGICSSEPGSTYWPSPTVHLAAEIAANVHGFSNYEFADFGQGPISYRPQVNRGWFEHPYSKDPYGNFEGYSAVLYCGKYFSSLRFERLPPNWKRTVTCKNLSLTLDLTVDPSHDNIGPWLPMQTSQ